MRFTFNAPEPFSQIAEAEKEFRDSMFPFPLNIFVMLYSHWKNTKVGGYHE